MGGVVPGSLKVLVISLSSCSALGILQFTTCPLTILSGVCFHLLEFLSRNPSRQRLTMTLLYVGFLRSSYLVLPNLNERSITLTLNSAAIAYAGTGNEDISLN